MTRLPLLLAPLLLIACSAGEASDAPAPASPAPATAMTELERGAIIWKRCRACHTLGEGERHKVGPNLWGVFGQSAGAREDFNYSRAMKAAGLVWSDETMDAYLEKPNDYIPGNRMTYAGLRKPEDRAAVIAYLRSETGASD